MNTSSDIPPIRERKLDFALAIIFSFFAFTSLAMDSLTGLNINLLATSYPFAKPIYDYAMLADPLLVVNPPALQVMCGISAFIFGPFTLWLVRALWVGDRRIRIPAIVYASAITYSMPVYFFIEFMSDTPPTHLPIFFGATLPYLLFPMVLLRHMWVSPFWNQKGS
jgi:hypothetical protein